MTGATRVFVSLLLCLTGCAEQFSFLSGANADVAPRFGTSSPGTVSEIDGGAIDPCDPAAPSYPIDCLPDDGGDDEIEGGEGEDEVVEKPESSFTVNVAYNPVLLASLPLRHTLSSLLMVLTGSEVMGRALSELGMTELKIPLGTDGFRANVRLAFDEEGLYLTGLRAVVRVKFHAVGEQMLPEGLKRVAASLPALLAEAFSKPADSREKLLNSGLLTSLSLLYRWEAATTALPAWGEALNALVTDALRNRRAPDRRRYHIGIYYPGRDPESPLEGGPLARCLETFFGPPALGPDALHKLVLNWAPVAETEDLKFEIMRLSRQSTDVSDIATTLREYLAYFDERLLDSTLTPELRKHYQDSRVTFEKWAQEREADATTYKRQIAEKRTELLKIMDPSYVPAYAKILLAAVPENLAEDLSLIAEGPPSGAKRILQPEREFLETALAVVPNQIDNFLDLLYPLAVRAAVAWRLNLEPYGPGPGQTRKLIDDFWRGDLTPIPNNVSMESGIPGVAEMEESCPASTAPPH